MWHLPENLQDHIVALYARSSSENFLDFAGGLINHASSSVRPYFPRLAEAIVRFVESDAETLTLLTRRSADTPKQFSARLAKIRELAAKTSSS
jgi:hypothetical protein